MRTKASTRRERNCCRHERHGWRHEGIGRWSLRGDHARSGGTVVRPVRRGARTRARGRQNIHPLVRKGVTSRTRRSNRKRNGKKSARLTALGSRKPEREDADIGGSLISEMPSRIPCRIPGRSGSGNTSNAPNAGGPGARRCRTGGSNRARAPRLASFGLRPRAPVRVPAAAWGAGGMAGGIGRASGACAAAGGRPGGSRAVAWRGAAPRGGRRAYYPRVRCPIARRVSGVSCSRSCLRCLDLLRRRRRLSSRQCRGLLPGGGSPTRRDERPGRFVKIEGVARGP